MTNNDTARASGATARPAVKSDTEAISEMLGRAFFDDPLTSFLLPDIARRAKSMPRLFGLLFKLGLPYGACDVTSGYEAAAIWRPPGHWHIPIHQYFTNGPQFVGVFGLGRGLGAMSTMDQIEKRHPKEPHYYLQAIGTDPAKQGKGFGGVVIRRQIFVADAANLPCYLESSKESNIPIYQSFGFELTGEIRIKGGPTLYPMWRKARA